MPAVLEGTPALEGVMMVEDAKKRRLTQSVGGGRGSATPSKEIEAEVRGDVVSRGCSKKKPVTFCKNTRRWASSSSSV